MIKDEGDEKWNAWRYAKSVFAKKRGLKLQTSFCIEKDDEDSKHGNAGRKASKVQRRLSSLRSSKVKNHI